jgi:hypothetical protein
MGYPSPGVEVRTDAGELTLNAEVVPADTAAAVGVAGG